MDGKNPTAGYHLCIALLGDQHRVILQLTDSPEPGEPARLYVHSQVDGDETVRLLADLCLHLSAVLVDRPDYFTRVRLPTDTGAIFRYIGDLP